MIKTTSHFRFAEDCGLTSSFFLIKKADSLHASLYNINYERNYTLKLSPQAQLLLALGLLK